jgi:hypothetical protein
VCGHGSSTPSAYDEQRSSYGVVLPSALPTIAGAFAQVKRKAP